MDIEVFIFLGIVICIGGIIFTPVTRFRIWLRRRR
jgi:hypothetical protein